MFSENSRSMDIFSTPSYRISPLAKREFSEKQKHTQTSDSTAGSTNQLGKGNNTQKFEEQPSIQRELQQLINRNHQTHIHEAPHIVKGYSSHKTPQQAAQTITPSAANHVVTSPASQMAATARIEIARMRQGQSNQQAISEPAKNIKGVAQYQRLERETNRETYSLNKYA